MEPSFNLDESSRQKAKLENSNLNKTTDVVMEGPLDPPIDEKGKKPNYEKIIQTRHQKKEKD